MTTLFAAEADRPHTPAVPGSSGGRPHARLRPWLWMTLASTLLAASGLTRVWQDRRLEAARARVIKPAFPLKDLPAAVGNWKQVEGAEVALDPEVALIAGSVDSLVRSYFDEETGVVVTAMFLLGQTETAARHRPEVCYPAAGYVQDDDLMDVNVDLGPSPVRFRSAVFKKEGGVAPVRQEVFYSFRHLDSWSPDVPGNWRDHVNANELYKVQVQRVVTSKERRTDGNPTVKFLAAMLPVLEKRIAVSRGGGKP